MTSTFDSSSLTRREALKRAAVVLGVAISPSLLNGVLRAQSAAAGAAGQPKYLTASQFAIVSAIVERILPRTDTPGAIDAGVPGFVDLMFGEFMTDEEKSRLTRGVGALQNASFRGRPTSFAELNIVEQDAVLKSALEAANNDPKNFFYQIKELAIVGYFTSEIVGKNVTHYDPIPGPFRAIVPISETGNKAWTR